MAPKPDEMTEKFKQILKSNGITDTVSEVIIKDSGLKGQETLPDFKIFIKVIHKKH